MTTFNPPERRETAPSLFYPRSIEEVKYKSGATLPPCASGGASSLLIVAEGGGELLLNGQPCTLTGATAVVCGAGADISIVPHGGRPLLIYHIVFESIPVGSRALPFAEMFVDGIPYRALELCKEMDKLGGDASSGSRYRFLSCFYELLHLLQETLSSSSRDNPIERTVAYMRAHYEEELSRQRLADVSGVSLDYFSHWFKHQTGQTYSDYLARIRIDRARELLLTSGAKVNDIAQYVGYKDAYYLSRKFKKVVGVAPTVYLQTPKKFVSLSVNCTAVMLSLGIVPAAAVINPWIERQFRPQLRSSKLFPSTQSYLKASRLASDNPDLIICYDIAGDIDSFRQIAPTLQLKLHNLHWREQLQTIASVTHSAEQAEQVLARFDEQTEQAKERLADRINNRETVATIEIFPDCIYVYGDSWGKGGQVLYDTLRLRPPQNMIVGDGYIHSYKRISPDDLSDYAADHMFVGIRPLPGAMEHAEAIMRGRVWNELSAVRNNRVYRIDPDMFYGFDPISLNAQLEEVVNRLTSN